MRRIFTLILALAVVTAGHAVKRSTVTMTVKNNRLQTITGFGAACCDGAMCPFGTDTNPVKLLYGDESKIGLNIMRMEISPNFEGDVKVPEWNYWDSPYDWNGSLPSAKIVKKRGGIVFGTPWSPPGEYKTNGTAQGGNADDQGNKKGKLREDCYDKFFPWLNTFLKWMKQKGVVVDAVSIQNEPDWWVSYSGCLYDPQDLVKLVKNHAHQLDRETYNGVRLISGESLGFTQNYTDPLMKDETCREQIDIVAGHLYGHAPLDYMKKSAVLATKYGKEVWMTEHSVSDNIGDRLPNWNEQLDFADELNECIQAGGTGYIYWYMRAHWAFVSTGESKYGTPNKTKNRLLPRAYVMSHFSKHVTGSTLLQSTSSVALKTNANVETSAFIKGDSLIVIAISRYTSDKNFVINLKDTPFKIASGEVLLSWGNETDELCQKMDLVIGESLDEDDALVIDEEEGKISVVLPSKSVCTYIFKLDNGTTAIKEQKRQDVDGPKTYYDLQGRRLDKPRGLCIERHADGTSRKILIED